jgi:predicted dehydrogenase
MTLKVGIVGMGGIGNLHATCYKNDPLAELVAVCDIIKEKADKAAERFGVKAFLQLKRYVSRMSGIGYRRCDDQRL